MKRTPYSKPCNCGSFSPRASSTSSVRALGQAVSEPAPEASPCPCPDSIRRNDLPITDGNRNVLPGQPINLSIKCDSFTLTEIQWHIPGRIFRGYKADDNEGKLFPIEDEHLKGKSVFFYWADTGDNREVSITFKADGVPCRKTAVLNVKKPLCEFDTIYFGTTRFSANGNAIGLFNSNTGLEDGIKWEARVMIPQGFGFKEGEWCFAQLLNGSIIVKKASGKCEGTTQNGKRVLDNHFPYGGLGILPTGLPVPAQEKDTPRVFLADDDEKSKARFDFWMYILFRPIGGRWVPLKVMHWGYSYCAEKADGNWAIVTKGEFKHYAGETTIHPQWKEHSPGETITVACPSTFCPI